MTKSRQWRRLLRVWRHCESLRRFGVGLWVLRLMILTPTPLGADSTVEIRPQKGLFGEHVLIEDQQDSVTGPCSRTSPDELENVMNVLPADCPKSQVCISS